MTDKEILEYALAAYEKAAEEKWDLGRLEKKWMDFGICLFLCHAINVDYAKTARILRLGKYSYIYDYPYPCTLENPLDGIIYRRDYLRKLLNE